MRIEVLEPDRLTEEQRDLYERILGGDRAQGQGRLRLVDARGGLIGPFNSWLLSPEIGGRISQLGEALRFRSSLPNHLLEIAILVTARQWRARFEWWAHARLARRAGVEPAIIDAIRSDREPDFEDSDQRVIYDFSRQLLGERQVSDELYEEARERLGERGIVDLVSLLGYYGLISMTLNVFQVPLPEGEEDPFGKS